MKTNIFMQKFIEKIVQTLQEQYGLEPWNWHTKQTPFQILIGTVLSQRTKDANTDKAAKQLFSKFSTAEQLANAEVSEIEELIKPSGFYKVKARRIKKISKIISDKYNGVPPSNIEELIKLPGVGRKTAGCVIVYGFGKKAIPVDVHVKRLSNRIGLVNTKTPEETEIELMRTIPKKYWTVLNALFVTHGQNTCLPRNPKCDACRISKYCNYFKINNTGDKNDRFSLSSRTV